MDGQIYILLAVFVQLRLSHSYKTFISGEISEDLSFIYKKFSVPPSMRAIIEVDVSYPISSVRRLGFDPIMGIYTTQDHINIKQRCVDSHHGQFRQIHLIPAIFVDHKDDSGRLSCKRETHCKGNITIQDFKPRYFSFSFGFFCDKVSSKSSLKGLIFNISINGQTNETECVQLPYNDICYDYIQHGVLHNLRGIEYQMEENLSLIRRIKIIEAIRYILFCYQNIREFFCHVQVPKCDPLLKQVIHPCREMCYDAQNACGHSLYIYIYHIWI